MLSKIQVCFGLFRLKDGGRRKADDAYLCCHLVIYLSFTCHLPVKNSRSMDLELGLAIDGNLTGSR